MSSIPIKSLSFNATLSSKSPYKLFSSSVYASFELFSLSAIFSVSLIALFSIVSLISIFSFCLSTISFELILFMFIYLFISSFLSIKIAGNSFSLISIFLFSRLSSLYSSIEIFLSKTLSKSFFIIYFSSKFFLMIEYLFGILIIISSVIGIL